jgi:type IV pilus assembly protein PilC
MSVNAVFATQTVPEKPLHLSLKERATITRQLSALIDAGLPIAKALRVILKQNFSHKLSQELDRILHELEEGMPLSLSFRRWDGFLISLIRAGEATGQLAEVLERLAYFYEARYKLQTKIITTLTYPIIIFMISMLIFLAMVTFILPQFSQIYSRLGGELPVYTRFWIEISNWIRSPYGGAALLALFPLLYLIRKNQDAIFQSLEKLLVPVPVLGEVIIQFAATRFARTLGTLLKCGVPLNQALDVAAISLFPLQEIKSQITEGVPLHQAMEMQGKFFPQALVSMVAVGEETGELSRLVLKAADFFDQELEGLLSRLTSLIEPAIIVLLGGLIGSVVIGMYLPMFQLFNQIQ